MSGTSIKRKACSQRPPREKKDLFFSRERKEERYKRCVLRKTVPHKVVELEWFVEKNFTFPRLLINQNLNFFCTLNWNVYPELVYEFYANLVKRKEVWVTNVCGITITLDHSVLETVGSLSNTGLSYEAIMDPEWDEFQALATYESCLRPGKRHDGRTMKTGLITVNDRLLHYVLVHVIAPRLSNRAQMVEEDLRYICAIKKGILVNWADVVLNIMIRRWKDPSGALPYPALVSKIIEHAQVDVTDSVKLSVRDGADKIGASVLNKMKISRKDGIWSWDEDEDLAEEEGPQITMSDLMARMQRLMDVSELIRGDIRELDERIDRRFAQVETRLGELERFDPTPAP